MSLLQNGPKRKIPLENTELVMSYYKTLYPDEELKVTANDVVCSNCYFLSRNLAKCSQSVDPNSDLNSIINKYKESFYKNKMDLAVQKSVIFVAKKILNNEAVLFPEVLDLYFSSSASDIDHSDANDPGDSDKNDFDGFDTNNPDHSDISNFDDAVSDNLMILSQTVKQHYQSDLVGC